MYNTHRQDPLLGFIFIAIGIILLAYVALHFASWIICAIVGWKLFSLGMRMQGYPPLGFLISRWF